MNKSLDMGPCCSYMCLLSMHQIELALYFCCVGEQADPTSHHPPVGEGADAAAHPAPGRWPNT